MESTMPVLVITTHLDVWTETGGIIYPRDDCFYNLFDLVGV